MTRTASRLAFKGSTGVERNQVNSVNVSKLRQNPVFQEVVLDFNRPTSVQGIEIWNVQGHLMQQIQLQNKQSVFRWDISSIASGSYIIRILTENKTEIHRLIKL